MRRIGLGLLALLVGWLVVVGWLSAAGAAGPARAVAGPAGTFDPELQRIVQDVLGARSGVYGVVVESLVDGRWARVNADAELETASIFKLFIMYEVFRQERLGRLSLDDTVVISARAAELSVGLPGTPAGTALSVREAVERMIQVSDNTCAVTLGDLVGWNRAREGLRAIGIRRTEFWPETTTTADDVARLLYLIGTDQAVDREASEAMLDILLGQRWNDRLPLGLPAGSQVGHKTGELGAYLHDAGIVVAPFGRYVIAVLSEGGIRSAFVELARLTHAYLGARAAGVY